MEREREKKLKKIMTIRTGTMESNGELVLHLITIQRKGMVNAEEGSDLNITMIPFQFMR